MSGEHDAASAVQTAKATDNPFSSVSLKKKEGFPRIATKDARGVICIITAADGASWMTAIRTWFNARGAPDILAFASKVSPLAENSEPLSLDPDNPDALELSLAVQKDVLTRASETTLGRHIGLPLPAAIAALSEDDTRKLFRYLRNFDGHIAFLIRDSATFEGDLMSCVPDLFDTQQICRDGEYLWGLTALQQMAAKLNRDPQGTAIQLKDSSMVNFITLQKRVCHPR